jgi:hypothetical protein
LVIENFLLVIDRHWRSAEFLRRHAEFSCMTNDKFSMINSQSLHLPKTFQGTEAKKYEMRPAPSVPSHFSRQPAAPEFIMRHTP